MSDIINSSTYGAIVKTRPPKGRMAWEYNPFKNLRLDSDKYKYKDKWYTKEEFEELGAVFNYKEIDGKDIIDDIQINGETILNDVEVHEKFELVDFDTSDLGFDITNPVDMLPLYSYDGTVNLILNDGKNIPRLINSRFSVLDSHSYEIVDRKGDNDTNIYDEGEQFDIDTSLYKRVNNIQKIDFKGVCAGGNMKVGNYHFYFKLSDADGNESDFIGQSGLVSLFIGYSDPHSIYTGTKDLNCYKMVNFEITNIDLAYSYVTVYYSRCSAELDMNIASDCRKIDKKFLVNSGRCNIQITGFEDTIEIPEDDLNKTYNIVDSAKTQALNGNRLFLGNVHKAEIPYKELEDLSLRFIPNPVTEDYALKMNQTYNISSKNRGYYDVDNIYHKVGYWPNEYYRLGIVYILKSGELSPVFNIRGGLQLKVGNDSNGKFINKFSTKALYEDDLKTKRKYIGYEEDTYLITEKNGSVLDENAKGVISCKIDDLLNKVLHIKISIQDDYLVLDEIRKYAKGFFFVRQKRIPTILAQGITVGIESESRTPVIPTKGGVLELVVSALGDNSHVVYETEVDSDNQESAAMHYVTEGFLSRYKAKFDKKEVNVFKKFAKIAGIVLGAVAIAAASVFTFGGAAIVTGAVLVTVGAVALPTLIVGSIVAGSLLVAGGIAQATASGMLKHRRKKNKKVYNGWNTKPKAGYVLKEEDSSRLVGGDFRDRLIIKREANVEVKGILCPDFALNQPYFNSIFTGNYHTIEEVNSQNKDGFFYNDGDRHFYSVDNSVDTNTTTHTAKLVGLRDNQKLAGIGQQKFRARAGEAEEIWHYEFVGDEYDIGKIDDNDGHKIDPRKLNSDILRGQFGPYIASDTDLNPCKVVNIYIPGYSSGAYHEYMIIRAEDKSPFYQISPRIDIQYVDEGNILNPTERETEWNLYGGDSYLCQYTHRLIRNFNDPSAPYNDVIIDQKTWKNHYDPDKKQDYNKVNLGDLNAVQLGMWITFRLRSSYNLNIRTIDESNVDEKAMTGHGRGYYPVNGMITNGTYKIADSQIYNKGFSVSVGSQIHFEQPDVPAIKNWFGTRIMYSDIHINDAFKNGYRVFQPTNYRDYTREYGELTKLVSYGNDLICVMEHGILSLKVNAQATNSTHLNIQNALPETPVVLSSDFGSQWKDSVIKTDQGIYGIDTVAKKIWRIQNSLLTLLSEGIVQEFLNRNIRLSERDTNVVLGRRNVKTLYNKFKYDVMFTFYNLTEFDECAWNLCYNEKMGKFVTFYSWIPSFMENIDNIPFSFDRETSRYLSIMNQTNQLIKVYTPNGKDQDPVLHKTSIVVGNKERKIYQKVLVLDDVYNTKSNIEYTLQDSKCKYNIYFALAPKTGVLSMTISNFEKLNQKLHEVNDKIIELDVQAEVYDLADDGKHINQVYYRQKVYLATEEQAAEWQTDFWRHGQAGIFDITEDVEPTKWYGKQHPFEFEFVVTGNIKDHKIFDDLEIISNAAEPESFHYEVIGDAYEFANDKQNMFIRQEATNKLYYNNGADVVFDENYLDMQEKQNKKSTILPLNYYHQDMRNNIYDWYVRKDGNVGKDYSHLAGGEVGYNKNTNEFSIKNHAQGVDLRNEGMGNRLRGNMHYREDTWKVQINPLNIVQENESVWYDNKIPFELSFGKLPDEVYKQGDLDILPEVKGSEQIRTWTKWNNYRMSKAKMKDKWMRIRIRYNGEKLAIISAIKTLFSISYS